MAQCDDFSRFDNARIEEFGQAVMMKVFYAFLALALVSAGLSYFGKQLGNRIALAGHTTDETIHAITIGPDVLAVPANMIRFSAERHSQELRKLDLYLSWPTLDGYTDATRALFNHQNGGSEIVFATFEPRSMGRDMSGRMTPIYRLLIEEPGVPAEGGLVAHRFVPASGYGEETLLVDPTRFRAPFVARCLPEEVATGTLAPCERDIDVGENLSMRYRFPRALLEDWKTLDAAMRAFAERTIQAGS